VTVNDGQTQNNTITKTFDVTVNGVNQQPTLAAIASVTINENAPQQTVNLSGISSGATNEAQTLTVTATSSNPGLIPNPTVNYTSPNATGSLNFTPAVNLSGSSIITVTVDDGQTQNNTVSRTFTVTVNGVNQAPTLDPIASVTINEDAGVQSVNLTGISSGASNEIQTLTVTATSSNPGLIPTPTITYSSPNSTGTLNYTPVANGSGAATLTVTVNDGGASNNIITRTFTVTVNAVNDAPTLNAIADLTINENAPQQTVNLAGISTGATNEVQTLTVTATSSNPSLIPNPSVTYASPGATGSLRFTPAVNLSGSSIITVTVDDGQTQNNTASRTFAVTVNGINQAPTIDPIASVTINEDAGLQSVNLTGITSGATNEIQTLTVTATSSNPGLIPTPSITYTTPNTTGTLNYAPTADLSGTATLTVTVNDGGASNNIVTRTFTVTVNAVNDAPTLNAIGDLTINENAGQQTVGLTGISTGASNEVQTLTVTTTSSNPSLIPNPTLTYTSPNATGSLRFTPAVNGFGTSTITVTVNDGQAQNNITTRTFNVTVNAVNQQPTLAAIGNVTINENAPQQTVSLSGISSGSTNEAQTLTVTATSSNPSLIPNPTVNYTSPNATGSLNFTPAANLSGNAIITVTVDDGQTQNNTVSRTFTVTVNGVNQGPTLDPIANVTINEDAGLQSVNLTGISSGASNEIQTLAVTASSSNPGLIPTPTITYSSPNSTGTLNYTPVANGNGAATLTVTVNDGGASNNVITRTFTVTINAVNDAPTLTQIADLTINENAPQQTVNLTGISTGATNEVQTLTVTATSSNPSLIPNPTVTYTSPNATGSLAFTPAVNGIGSATISVTVNDGQAQNNTIIRTFNVTVSPVNQQPTLTALSNVTITENAGQQTVNLSGITSGASNEIQTLTVTASSSNPGVIPTPAVNYTSPNTTGNLTFTPAANAAGTSTISVTVNDGQAQNNTITRTFVVTVNSFNAPPTLDPIGSLSLNKNAAQQSVNLSGISSGASNEVQALTVTATSGNTALVPNPTVIYTSPNSTGSLSFTPVANAFGTATISVTVNDGQSANNTVTRTFVVTANDPPTISSIADQGTPTNTPTPPLAFTIGDSETAASSLTLTGTSSDTNIVAPSGIVFGGSASNRLVMVTPVPGVTGFANVTITVSDGSAIASTSFNLNVYLARPRPPTLLIVTNGNGSVTPNLSAEAPAIGKTYTVTAVPAAGQEFAGWTGSVISSSPTISFVMAADTHLEANFVPSTFSAEKGAYNGLFYEPDQVLQNSSGCFSINTTPRGTFSGKLQIGAIRYALKGKFDASGQVTNKVTSKNGTPLTVELRVGSGPQADKIYGRVTDGNWVANLSGDKNIFKSNLNPPSQQGTYTLVIPGVPAEASLPAGDGYAPVNVSPNGLVKMVGMLADGTKISQGAPLSKDGEWPLYLSLYKGNGSALSWMNFANRTNDDINGALNWIKLPSAGGQFYPAGFTRQYDAVGSAYAGGGSTLQLTAGNIVFSGGDLASDVTNSVAFGPGNKVTDPANSAFKMSFSSKGTFKGTIDLGTGEKSQFSGVVFQKKNVGNGLLLGTSQSSSVLVAQ
jgi:hypothetical protein